MYWKRRVIFRFFFSICNLLCTLNGVRTWGCSLPCGAKFPAVMFIVRFFIAAVLIGVDGCFNPPSKNITLPGTVLTTDQLRTPAGFSKLPLAGFPSSRCPALAIILGSLPYTYDNPIYRLNALGLVSATYHVTLAVANFFLFSFQAF